MEKTSHKIDNLSKISDLFSAKYFLKTKDLKCVKTNSKLLKFKFRLKFCGLDCKEDTPTQSFFIYRFLNYFIRFFQNILKTKLIVSCI